MCSGDRSSSANGAIALRQSAERSWSTSSSRVLSDWTIRGPSCISGSPWKRECSERFRGVIRHWRQRPSAGRGRPRRWRARSSGRSSSAATGWGRCRRRRWCTARPRRCRAGLGPRSQTRLARPSSASPTSSSATDWVLDAAWMWRCSGSWLEICGVIGWRTISSLIPSMTAAVSPVAEASKTGLSSRWNFRTSMQSRSVHWRTSHSRSARWARSASTSVIDALSRPAERSA